MRINNINLQYQNNNRIANKNVAQKQNSPSFSGIKEVVSEPLSRLYDSVAGSTGFQKFVSKFSRTNSFTHLMFADSCILSGFYMLNTLRNKKIKKEQKPQMLINDALTLGVSATGAYFLDDKVSGLVTKFTDNYFASNSGFYIEQAKQVAGNKGIAYKKGIIEEIGNAAINATDDVIANITTKIGEHFKGMDKTKAFQVTGEKLKEVQDDVANAIRANKGNSSEAIKAVTGTLDDVYDKLAGKFEANKLMPGINKIKTLVVFGLIYRYIGPVLVTPLANKLSSKFFDKKNEKAQKA